MKNHATDYLIIGAGIAGLMMARTLRDADRQVIVLDKARGVGGRMATRRLENGVFDHGAQFFTVRDPEFQAHVDTWIRDGLVKPWSPGFSEGNSTVRRDGHMRYRGEPGMTAVPKQLSAGLDVRLQQRVLAAAPQENGWQVTTDDGAVYQAKTLVLSAPIPQSITMLDAGAFDLPQDARTALEHIQYDPCIALMVLTSARGSVPEPGGIRFQEGEVQWVADNFRKGISQAFGLTLHTSPAFSRQHWDEDEATLRDRLMTLARPWIGGEVLSWSIQKWRFSQPRTLFPAGFLHLPGPHPLVMVGDAFGGQRVEGAALSGLAAAAHLLEAN